MKGSVYWRESDSRWVAKYPMPPDPLTGKKRKPKYMYSSIPGRKGLQEIKRKLFEFSNDVESGNLSSTNKMSVKGWLEKYMQVYCKKCAQTTKDGYNNYINNHIIPIMGDLKLKDVRSIHIENYYNLEREKGYSETTLLQQHRILNRAFSKAVKDRLIDRNPFEGVDAPSKKEFKPTIYSEEEYNRLLSALEGHRMEVPILLAGMCGLRRGEISGLDWSDVDLDNGIVHVYKNRVPTSKGAIVKDPKSKTGTRDVAIPSAIIGRLKKLKGIGKIVLRLDGKEYHPSTISKYFKEFLEENNFRHIRLHDLRHFNATMMLKYGVSEREAQEQLGHSSSAMTKKYQHPLADMKRKSANKLNSIFKSGVKHGVK